MLTLLLHAPRPLSIPALAAQLGISRNATHQHMSGLERDRLVERAEQISTGGRPSQGYRLSAAGRAFFPRQYALLARNLVAELARHVGPEALPGAMARLIQDTIKQPLAEELLFGKLAQGGEVHVSIRDEKPAFELAPAAPKVAKPRPKKAKAKAKPSAEE